MKEFAQIMPKQGKEEQVAKLGTKSSVILDLAMQGKLGDAIISDLHGVGILETSDFLLVYGTFPSLTEECRITIRGAVCV